LSPSTSLDDLEKKIFLNLSGFDTLVVQPVAMLRVGDIRNTYKILLGKTEGGGGQFEILTHILKDNIKTDFKEKMRNSVDCLSLIPSKQL